MRPIFTKRVVKSSDIFDSQHNVKPDIPPLRAFAPLVQSVFSTIFRIKLRVDAEWGGYFSTGAQFAYLIEAMPKQPKPMMADEYFKDKLKLTKEESDNILYTLAQKGGLATNRISVEEKFVTCIHRHNGIWYRIWIGHNRPDPAIKRAEAKINKAVASGFMREPIYHQYFSNPKIDEGFTGVLAATGPMSLEAYVGLVMRELRIRLLGRDIVYAAVDSGVFVDDLKALEKGSCSLVHFFKMCAALQVNPTMVIQTAQTLYNRPAIEQKKIA